MRSTHSSNKKTAEGDLSKTDNFKRTLYAAAVLLMLLFFHSTCIQAQTATTADSVARAAALKMQQDSLEAATKMAATQAAADSAKADSLKASGTTMQPDSVAKKDAAPAPAATTTTTATTTGAATTEKQKKKRPAFGKIGINFNSSFWLNSKSTYFEFFPSIEYRFPKTYSIGAGPVFVYKRDRVHDVDLKGWGGKIFTRAQLTKWFYAYTEYQGVENEYISYIDAVTNNVTESTTYVDSWFLSLGLNLRLGRRHGFNLQVLYDLLYDDQMSPHLSAWTYRVGFGF